MNNSTHEPLEGMLPALIRRGLPADYASRAVAELEDHRRDLIEELRAAGRGESEAVVEASRRLGDERTLVKNTVRAYQRRYWCARWPLITFLLGPIPVLIASWYAIALGLRLIVSFLVNLGYIGKGDAEAAFNSLPIEFKYSFLMLMFLVIPAVVTHCFARLVKRAGLGWQWVVLVACILGLFAGAWKFERVGPGSRLVMRDRQTLRPIDHPPKPAVFLTLWLPINAQQYSWTEIRRFFLSNPAQPCQLLLPAAVAGLFLARRRQLALRAERFWIDGC